MTDPRAADVAIVGGGIMGACAALFLRRLGHSVILLEAALCGSKASGVNYGGVRRQGRSLDQLPLSQRAHALWRDIRQLAGIEGEYVRSGHLKLARTAADMAALEAYRQTSRGFGLDLRLLSGPAFHRQFPWLDQTLVGGSLCPEDGHANPRLVSPALAQAARRAGAEVHEQTRVLQAARTEAGFLLVCDRGLRVRAESVINCAGAWGHEIARLFGREVPESALYPLMMVTEPLPLFMTVSLGMQGGGVYARQVERGNCVIGGGRGYASNTQFARPGGRAINTLMREAGRLIPALAHAQVIRFWSGYEGGFDDGNPVLGPDDQVPGLFHAFGFSGAGFQLGPAVGEALADLVHAGRARIPLDAFDIRRFGAQSRQLEPALNIAGQRGQEPICLHK
ncbi:NAD(P)/FAD-dependent oxidoreductase [Castellaniella hirudinis]|uniref:NAD(P)/FAD-dependent oxidoreductase n=1 Tax=Castellaniella hirudinis TaxID=1144617 RepID=UPI0039C093DF